MNRDKRRVKRPALLSALEYVSILFFIFFILTSSFMLFFEWAELENDKIVLSALFTFGNAMFMALIIWGFYKLKNRFTVDRPVKRISDSLEKIASGDFSVRLEPITDPFGSNRYNSIIYSINKMAEELSGVETLRTDFISNVSHEMKTPLAVIQNYASLLSVPEISHEERLEYVKGIKNSSNRLSLLITNILKLNKLENQQIFPRLVSYDLSEQICECLLQFEDIWEKKDIEIDTDIEDEIIISGDPELISLVWNNLFSNAFKFTEEKGRVRVSVRGEGENAVVCVEDTGCGMDSETQKHIFDKFYQGDSSHTSKGNGLGLALAKRVTDIMKGEITVCSRPGKGSSFTVKMKRGIKEDK